MSAMAMLRQPSVSAIHGGARFQTSVSRRSALQWQQVRGVFLENAAEELAVCLAHVPSDNRGWCDLDCDIIPCGEHRTHSCVRKCGYAQILAMNLRITLPR